MLSLDIKDEIASWYYPDIAGNLDKPENERFAVKVSPMTGKQKRAKQRVALSKKTDTGAIVASYAREVIEKQVVDVVNLSVTRDGQPVPVTNGKELWKVLEDAPASWLSIIDGIVEFAEGEATLSESEVGN